jgi:trimeric autotransporter adhesin
MKLRQFAVGLLALIACGAVGGSVKSTGGGGGSSFTAGGDLTGTSSSQTIAKIAGTTLNPNTNSTAAGTGALPSFVTPTITAVSITGTAGQFACTCTGMVVGATITFSGTPGGTGSITGYTDPTDYYVSATNGTSTLTLKNLDAYGVLTTLVTTAGTPTGLTYTPDAATGANTAYGTSALSANTTYGENSAFGYQALAANTAGYENVAFGDRAMASNTTGNSDTAVGYFALITNTTGSFSTAVGFEALHLNTTGASNTAVGADALYTNGSGINNVAVGTGALFTNLTANGNTATGWNALYLDTGSGNTANGYQALYHSAAANFNTGFGYYAGLAITSGASDLALGPNAGSGASATVTGSNDVVIADSALCLPASTSASDEVDLCTSSTYLLRITGGATPSTSATTIAGTLNVVGALSQNGSAIRLSIPTGTATFAGGTGVTSVACAAGFSCNNTRGTLTIVGGTGTTGTIATVSFSAALSAAPACFVSMNGGAATFDVGNSAPTTTAFNITAGLTIVGATFNVNYVCQP